MSDETNLDKDQVAEQQKGFWVSLSLRQFLVSIILIIVGFLLTFLPIILNPSNWNSVPETLPRQYAFVFDLVVPGLLLFLVGMVLLFYSVFIAMRRAKAYYAERRRVAFGLYKRSIAPAIAGAIAYVFVTMIQSAVMPIPQVLQPDVLQFNAQDITDIFLGGCFAAFCVSYYCYLYHQRIAPNNVVTRAIIYSAFALFIVDGALTLWHLTDSLNYFLLRVAVDSPRFLTLGLVVGIAIKRNSYSNSEFQ